MLISIQVEQMRGADKAWMINGELSSHQPGLHLMIGTAVKDSEIIYMLIHY